jgi:Zn-dependent membrane protease YugP
MAGETPQLTPLETRKQLLLVESELNRVQLGNEFRDFKSEILRLKNQVFEMGSLTSLATAFSAVGRAISHRDEGDETSWISTLLSCARAGTSLWRWFRSRRRQA